MIGKTGSVLSRFSRFQFKTVDHDGPVKIYVPSNQNILIEFGVRDSNNKFYVEIFDFSGSSLYTYEESIAGINDILSDDIENLQFVTSDEEVFIFLGATSESKIYTLQVIPGNYLFINPLIDQFTPPPPITSASASFTASGYDTEYVITALRKGEEGLVSTVIGGAKLPITVGEMVEFDITVASTLSVDADDINEVRIYRRPADGGAFGFVGSSSDISVSGSDIKASFTDIGGAADFSNQPPTLVTREGISGLTGVRQHVIGTGTIYQGRLLLGNFIDYKKEAIAASRPGFRKNFYRDYPYDGDSALLFKAGTEGGATILRMVESDGLVVFTTKGVFTNSGLLSVNNLSLVKRGAWVIDENVPPLVIPGGLFFVDKTTSSVRQLVYSTELASYDSVEQSIFSAHLFRERTIKSWCFQEGVVPVIIVSFSDGTFATFSFNSEHRMRAWTRHDSLVDVEQVVSTSVTDTSFFVVNNNGSRSIERTIPRITPPVVKVENPESDKYAYGAFMDSMVVNYTLLNDLMSSGETLTLTPTTVDDWEGTLTLDCETSALFTSPGAGDEGTIFRVFNETDGAFIDLEVVSRTDDNEVIVQPSEEFPSAQSSPRIYGTHTIITGLSHLEGEEVSVMVDGNVISSPNNDNDNESSTTLSVSLGAVTLPEEYRSAITIVGRPITADVKTLNISTAEQSPTMIESLTANKLYVRTHDSKGLYVDNQYPEEKIGEEDGSTVAEMQSFDDYYEQSNVPVTANRSKRGLSRRAEVTIPGSWENQGQMAFRQVDPLHFEILSIIADIEVHRRS